MAQQVKALVPTGNRIVVTLSESIRSDLRQCLNCMTDW
jgi:hypothetical protein